MEILGFGRKLRIRTRGRGKKAKNAHSALQSMEEKNTSAKLSMHQIRGKKTIEIVNK